MFRIDDHVGIAIAGLTSDARVLRCFLGLTVYNMRSDLTAATLCDSKQWENV
jgi:20S proteasome alpha/beta subunit